MAAQDSNILELKEAAPPVPKLKVSCVSTCITPDIELI